MKLTIFYLNGSTQVLNLDEKFFKNEKKNLLTPLEVDQKAKTVAQSVAEDGYYNYHLEYNKQELLNDFH